METPLLNALLEHIRLEPASFHMPGHKGRMGELEAICSVGAMDVTELPDTGDLYQGGDVIQAAEELWAKAWGFAHCQFLTCGSTQGIHAALLLCARRGREVLVDRGCHRSVYNALALCGLSPTYLTRRPDQPISPQRLEQALDRAEKAGKSISTVCITSPTYYGVLSDVGALAEAAHRHKALLVVDAAHGCHLPFLGANPFLGADLVVTSAHKTLRVYGQGALLFGSGACFDARDLRWAAGVAGTSSPSYPIMASMDWARAKLEEPEGRRGLVKTVEAVETLRGRFPTLRGVPLDPLRFTLVVNARAADGGTVARRLEAAGVFPEMADRDHVVFLPGEETTPRELERLSAALEAAEADCPGVFDGALEPPQPPEPEVILSPARVLTAPRRTAVLAEAEGEIAAQQVAPYPPGVPVIAPGERVTKKCLAYLREVGYNVQEEVDILDPQGVDIQEGQVEA